MKLPKDAGEYKIYNGLTTHRLLVYATWTCEVYDKNNLRIFKSDYDGEYNQFLSEYSLAGGKKIQGFSCTVSGDAGKIEKDGFSYFFTSDNAEKFVKDNLQQINAYFLKKANDKLNIEIEKKMGEFKSFLSNQESQITNFIDKLSSAEFDSRDLFLSEAALSYAKSFEKIVSSFKEPKIKSQIRSLFTKIKF